MSRARRAKLRFGQGLTRRIAPRVGLDVVSATFYGPVPKVPPVDDPIWSKETRVDVDTGSQIEFVETALAPYLVGELPQGLDPANRAGFRIWNGLYQAGDAELLYALVRYLKPKRVLELGSGYSTLISAAAAAANVRDGDETELVAVDPEPRALVPAGLDGLKRIDFCDCRELPNERFSELDAGDILFVDTSHVVKLGSEVNWLILEVLPALKPGVWVHFHDVFLPFEYPHYLFGGDVYFNEQYLLQAFLLGNAAWEVKLAMCALYRRERERLIALVPSLAAGPPNPGWEDVVPSAFWIRRGEG